MSASSFAEMHPKHLHNKVSVIVRQTGRCLPLSLCIVHQAQPLSTCPLRLAKQMGLSAEPQRLLRPRLDPHIALNLVAVEQTPLLAPQLALFPMVQEHSIEASILPAVVVAHKAGERHVHLRLKLKPEIVVLVVFAQPPRILPPLHPGPSIPQSLHVH